MSILLIAAFLIRLAVGGTVVQTVTLANAWNGMYITVRGPDTLSIVPDADNNQNWTINIPPVCGPVTSTTAKVTGSRVDVPLLAPCVVTMDAQILLPVLVTMTATPSMVAVGAPITLTWNVTQGTPGARDWVSLYPVGVPDTSYGDWKSTDGALMGTFTTPAPAVGSYEFRYLRNNGYVDIARSLPVVVQ